MKFTSRSLRCASLGALLALSIFSMAAFAGPPLICHPFEINGANSLPWVSHNWNLNGNETYDTKKLVADAVAILNSSQSVLVHMETLRRATLYAKSDPVAAKQLLVMLVSGTKNPSSNAQSEAFRLFDAGYLVETYKQWLGDKNQNPANGLDGYALVKEAIRLRGNNDPQMEFAAALISLDGPVSEQREFARKAIAGAKNDSLLARNLSLHFLGEKTETMAEMIGRTKMAKE